MNEQGEHESSPRIIEEAEDRGRIDTLIQNALIRPPHDGESENSRVIRFAWIETDENRRAPMARERIPRIRDILNDLRKEKYQKLEFSMIVLPSERDTSSVEINIKRTTDKNR